MTPSSANNLFILLENFTQWENIDNENPSYSRIVTNFRIFHTQTKDDKSLEELNKSLCDCVELIRLINLEPKTWKTNRNNPDSKWPNYVLLFERIKQQVMWQYGSNFPQGETGILISRFFRDALKYYLVLYTEKIGHLDVEPTTKHNYICANFDSIYSDLFSEDKEETFFELFELLNEAKGYLQLYRTYKSFITKARLLTNFEETLTEIREFLISELVGHTENETNASISKN